MNPTTIEATFDGTVFRPTEPVALAPNTTVRLLVESIAPKPSKPASFLNTAKSLNLDGPADWSANVDKYLYEKESADG